MLWNSRDFCTADRPRSALFSRWLTTWPMGECAPKRPLVTRWATAAWLVVLAFSDDHPSVGNAAQGMASVPAEGSHSPIDGTMLRRPKVQAA